MTTIIGNIADDSTSNILTVADLMDRINTRRAESNLDFLDDTKIIDYINDAIDELNAEDDFKGNLRSKTYSIDTNTTRFYLFTTIFGTSTPFERIQEIRFSSDVRHIDPLSHGADYIFEADPVTGGQGITFISDITASLDFDYYQFIPKITATTDIIAVDHLSNRYFIYKVLQYVYESEWIPDKMAYCKGEASDAISKLIANNTHMYDEECQPSPLFNY